MSGQSNPVMSRRAVYCVAGVLTAAILIPSVPAIASSFSGGSGGAGSLNSHVVKLEVVARGVKPAAGQISQPLRGQSIFIACPDGRVLGGGYELPDGETSSMVVSAPSMDSKRWNFRHPDLVPVGTKYYAICS
jgi:hypothetical protein